MAVKPRTTDQKLRTFGDNVQLVVWSDLRQSTSDTGDPFECPGASDRSVQLGGVLGTGGVVTMQGSNDGTNWATLNDPLGNDVALTAIGMLMQISEITRYIRPSVSAGDGATILTVTMIARRE